MRSLLFKEAINPGEAMMIRRRLTARGLAALTLEQLRTHEQHLLVRAAAPHAGIAGSDQSHYRQIREVRAEIAGREAL